MPANKAINTQLFYASAATVATKVANINSLDVGGGATNEIDTSTFDDSVATFVAGRRSNDSITAEVVVDGTAHAVIEALYISGAIKNWIVIAPIEATGAAHAAPTVAGEVITAPTTADSIKFSAFVSNFAINVRDENVWRGTITLKPSGQRTFTAGA